MLQKTFLEVQNLRTLWSMLLDSRCVTFDDDIQWLKQAQPN